MNKETTARKRWPHQCRGQSQWRTQWSIRVLAQSQESMGRPRVMSLHRWASRGGATWRTMTSDQLGCRDLIKRSFNWMTDGEMWREGVCVCVVTMLHHQFILKHIHWPRHTHIHTVQTVAGHCTESNICRKWAEIWVLKKIRWCLEQQQSYICICTEGY